MKLLCFGYGQVAKHLVSNLLKKKVNLNLTISTRENSSIKKLGEFEFENLEFKENVYDKKILDKLNEYDYILISVPPINSNDLFLKKNIERLQDYSGSIDDLIYTLNETRIWLYITNQKQWIPNNSWVEQVKNIEDKLSEEIHQSLMQKFVDKNKSEVVQNLNISEKNISVSNHTYVMIKDEKIGVITGFKIFFDEKFNDILNNNYKKIIKELDEWWKKKIDSPDFESTSEYVFFIELPTKNLKDNILIEKRIEAKQLLKSG